MNIDSQKRIAAKKAYSAAGLRETVHTKKSQGSPFIIYYTKTGMHAADSTYIDSLESYLLQAYELIQNSLGMKKGILGAAKTDFYEQEVPQGFYPVEVMDTGLAGDCGILGSVFPPNIYSPNNTQISIENDFIFGTSCQFGNQGDYMADNILEILKVTAFHELYHSFQTAYSAISNNNIFWMEAGATGVEEIAMPNANYYISSLSSVFQKIPRMSINSFDFSSSERDREKFYSYATLYLFLYDKIGRTFDSAIWDYFSKNPRDKFPVQLARLADSLGLDAEDLFHEYAKRVFYSGSRANSSPYQHFWPDMPRWPNWKTNLDEPAVLPAGTFDFIGLTGEREPGTDSVLRKTPLNDGRNIVWAISRLLRDSAFFSSPQKFAAFPNPWNPKNPNTPVLYFNLPEKTEAVEIRTSNGALLERVRGEAGKPLAWQPKKIPAPGILYYRTLPYGKNKVLIVSY
jgi:hypothetical protein